MLNTLLLHGVIPTGGARSQRLGKAEGVWETEVPSGSRGGAPVGVWG